jgi:hypothetical protein
MCTVLAHVMQAVTSDPHRFQENVRRHWKVAEEFFPGFDIVNFRSDDFAKSPNWNPPPSSWRWEKIPIPPSCTAYQGIGHIVRREGKLFDLDQNIALGCATAR